MCGRFALFTPPLKVAKYLQANLFDGGEDWTPSWNVPPMRRILAARDEVGDDGKITRTLQPYRWGLVPVWAKEASVGNRAFNARAETVATKPTFRSAFKKRRVIIPADNFYEWKKEGKEKQPHAFRRTDGELLALAGLVEFWNAPEAEEWMGSATIITTDDGPDMDGIHNRMPVILGKDVWDRWLDPELDDRDELEGMMKPAKKGTLEHFAVNKEVGKVGNDGAEMLIENPS